MPMIGSRPAWRSTLALALAACGCVVTGDAGALTTDATEGSTSVAADSDAGEESTTDPIKLDIGEVVDMQADECVSVTQTTTIEEAPSDIVVAVAGVLDEEQLDSIFENFSQLVGDSDVDDVRVAMLAGYPPDGVCIDAPPLGVQACPTTDDNPPIYRHFDEVVEPDTLLQQLLDTHPQWSTVLRPEARKHVFVVSSSDATLSSEDFDAAFTALDPGLAEYVFHAMAPGVNAGDCGIVEAGEPWAVADEYAALAAATGGVFENACNFNVGLLFEQLLDRIVEVALSCEYDIPAPPAGQVFDPQKINVDYDDGFGIQTVGWVETAEDCAGVDNGWYFDDFADPQRILMCPQTCARFQVLQEASIEIRFGCTTIPAG